MKLLQIAYHYPPMGGAGVQRALKFSKYLPGFGITPVVLAAEEPGYVSDTSLLADLPLGVRVERIAHQPLLGRLRALLKQGSPSGAAPAVSVAPEGAAYRWKLRVRDALLQVYASSQFPDDKAGWARRAFRPACDLVRQEGVDLILATAPTYAALGLAARVSAATGCPWVADYRDLWTNNPGYVAPNWRAVIDRGMERRWLRTASGVVAVTPLHARLLRGALGAEMPVAMIPNGYDEEDFTSLAARRASDSLLRVAYVGTFYGHQSPLPLLRAVDSLFESDGEAATSRLRLELVGNVGARFADPLAAWSRRWPGILRHIGFVPHAQAVQAMLDADLLLLIIGGGSAARGVLTGKIFEYLRTGRPVLLLGPPDGDAADLLRAHAACAIAPADDEVAIASLLGRLLRGEGLQARPAQAQPERFERRALTGELATFLRSCLDRAHGRP